MDKVWWNKVPNASHFLRLVIDSIQSGQSVLLHIPKTFPWYMTMQDIITSELRKVNSTRSCKFIRDNGEDPGEHLFKEFCKREKRARYRPNIGYPKFLANSDDIPLNQHILWICGAETAQVKKWYGFIDEYKKALGKNKNGCLFILEATSPINSKEKKGIRVIDYDKIIEYYDNYLFNMLSASKLNESAFFKQYLSEAVSLMIPNDIELSSKCVLKGREFLTSPIDTLYKIIEEDYKSDGSDFVLTATEKQLSERLWKAQIKVIFPLIENHRNLIITKYKKEIQPLLPIQATYGEEFSEASEVELGTFAYLVKEKKIKVDEADYKRVHILKNARNILAHLGTLSQKQVDEIFDLKTNI